VSDITSRIAPDARRFILRVAWVFSLVLVAAFMFFSAVLAVSLIERAKSDARSMVSALQQYAIRTMDVSSLVAEDALAIIAAAGGVDMAANDAAAHAAFAARAEKLPLDSVVIAVNAAGQVVLNTQEFPATRVDLSDRAWFHEHAVGGQRRVVGKAISSRVVARKIFTYSEAITTSDGRFTGVLNFGIPSDVVIGPNALPNYGQGVALSILRHDGHLVARNDFPDDLVEARLALPQGYSEVSERTGLMPTLVTGESSVMSYASIPEHGLIAVASIPLTSVLSPLFSMALAGFPLLLLVLAATYYLTRTAVRSFDDLRRAAEVNEVLLREVHHRVKNNLQIISSLLQQQARRSGPEVATHLEEATARVAAIALVHEQVYGNAAPSNVDLSVYLQTLAKNLQTTFGADSVVLDFDMQPLEVTINDAVPLALITTEALSNAFKHAFDNRSGRLSLSLTSDAEHHRLTVSDDGVGMPDEAAPNLGMNLIRALSRQLDATFGMRKENGTVFWLEWTRAEAVSDPLLPASGR
jgi:two-component sensor histidine kinase